ncbi:hypothetical protein PPERSA_06958 [Pseudocohnilembus persalinus]|uniref:Uncharacterized protein n=1 Tax=Pseudocohnilembus persalinus TaxID=266149 RepID=A0A0V0QYC6_PSEPJ|nr:hypothetical protein PPERSA_06958 [Pseudocohnilembus persalinus]|eukprot:KRX07343.1 hypothetical protein PPERSA_06958 [Pseudocohnilembus persalinus]
MTVPANQAEQQSQQQINTHVSSSQQAEAKKQINLIKTELQLLSQLPEQEKLKEKIIEWYTEPPHRVVKLMCYPLLKSLNSFDYATIFSEIEKDLISLDCEIQLNAMKLLFQMNPNQGLEILRNKDKEFQQIFKNPEFHYERLVCLHDFLQKVYMKNSYLDQKDDCINQVIDLYLKIAEQVFNSNRDISRDGMEIFVSLFNDYLENCSNFNAIGGYFDVVSLIRVIFEQSDEILGYGYDKIKSSLIEEKYIVKGKINLAEYIQKLVQFHLFENILTATYEMDVQQETFLNIFSLLDLANEFPSIIPENKKNQLIWELFYQVSEQVKNDSLQISQEIITALIVSTIYGKIHMKNTKYFNEVLQEVLDISQSIISWKYQQRKNQIINKTILFSIDIFLILLEEAIFILDNEQLNLRLVEVIKLINQNEINLGPKIKAIYVICKNFDIETIVMPLEFIQILADFRNYLIQPSNNCIYTCIIDPENYIHFIGSYLSNVQKIFVCMYLIGRKFNRAGENNLKENIILLVDDLKQHLQQLMKQPQSDKNLVQSVLDYILCFQDYLEKFEFNDIEQLRINHDFLDTYLEDNGEMILDLENKQQNQNQEPRDLLYIAFNFFSQGFIKQSIIFNVFHYVWNDINNLYSTQCKLNITFLDFWKLIKTKPFSCVILQGLNQYDENIMLSIHNSKNQNQLVIGQSLTVGMLGFTWDGVSIAINISGINTSNVHNNVIVEIKCSNVKLLEIIKQEIEEFLSELSDQVLQQVK